MVYYIYYTMRHCLVTSILQAFSCGSVMPNQAFPNVSGPPLSMSAYLRFGCLSIRRLYWGVRDAYLKVRARTVNDHPSVGPPEMTFGWTKSGNSNHSIII